jgi:hypothetical protein
MEIKPIRSIYLIKDFVKKSNEEKAKFFLKKKTEVVKEKHDIFTSTELESSKIYGPTNHIKTF